MKILGLIIAGAIAALSQTASASVVMMPSGTPDIILHDWGVARQMTARNDPYSSGPVKFGQGVTFSSTSADSVIGNTSKYGFGTNGAWKGTPMAGLNAAKGSIIFDFDAPVSKVIADLNWSPDHSDGLPVFMSIFNSANELLETFQLFGDGADPLASGYYGFSRGTADISRLVLSNGFIGARNLYTNAQDQGYSYRGRYDGGDFGSPHGEGLQGGIQAPVPEPATWAMMILGFGACGAMLRRNRAPVLA